MRWELRVCSTVRQAMQVSADTAGMVAEAAGQAVMSHRGLIGRSKRMKITPNGGDNPCVCGFIHPCCRYLVAAECPHRTPGDHKHAPDRPVIGTQQEMA